MGVIRELRNYCTTSAKDFPHQKDFQTYLTSNCKMRYIAAYMLAVMSDNPNPSVDDIKKILASVGVEAEEENLNIVINQLKGKNLEMMEKGKSCSFSVPVQPFKHKFMTTSPHQTN